MGLFWKRRPHLQAQRGRAGAVVGALSATCRCDTVANRLINAHATSTRIGDSREAQAIAQVFGDYKVPVTSTKSQTGHEMWMAGASELIYSTLMMKNGFIAGNINFEHPDEDTACLNIIPQTREAHFDMFLSNSFGFGGTNSTLIVKNI